MERSAMLHCLFVVYRARQKVAPKELLANFQES